MTSLKREDGYVFVPAGAMEDVATAIFKSAGFSDVEAKNIATRLNGANLRGHDSHGVIRIPRYVQYLQEGDQLAGQTVTVDMENDVIAVLDGHFGFGQTVGEQAVDIGVAKALKNGVAITALKHAGHLGRIGDWAERAAASNVVSIHMVNVRGSLIVAPFGAVERRGSTSPFCAGIPLPGEDPIILDMATSTVAEGKALVALRGGKPLPHGAVVDGDGSLTADPKPVYGDTSEGRYPNPNMGPGALTTFGDHKGSGMNFLMEMMAGALTGSGTAAALTDTKPRRFCNGMFSVYLSVEFFHSDDGFAREVKSYVEYWKSAKPAVEGVPVLIPGDKEKMTMAERRAGGLPLSEDAWGDIVTTGLSVGLTQGDIDSLVEKHL